jgi:hypothetical protein
MVRICCVALTDVMDVMNDDRREKTKEDEHEPRSMDYRRITRIHTLTIQCSYITKAFLWCSGPPMYFSVFSRNVHHADVSVMELLSR